MTQAQNNKIDEIIKKRSNRLKKSMFIRNKNYPPIINKFMNCISYILEIRAYNL